MRSNVSQQLTYDESIELVLAGMREHRGEWKIIGGDLIRRELPKGRFACPITSIEGEPCSRWLGVAVRLGLARNAKHVIVEAADDLRRMEGSENLRRRMLRAGGLRA